MITKKDDYNNVPVHYCKTCLSLAVKEVKITGNSMERSMSYCSSCSNTDMGTAHIDEWSSLYKAKYGKDFLHLPEKRDVQDV